MFRNTLDRACFGCWMGHILHRSSGGAVKKILLLLFMAAISGCADNEITPESFRSENGIKEEKTITIGLKEVFAPASNWDGVYLLPVRCYGSSSHREYIFKERISAFVIEATEGTKVTKVEYVTDKGVKKVELQKALWWYPPDDEIQSDDYGEGASFRYFLKADGNVISCSGIPATLWEAGKVKLKRNAMERAAKISEAYRKIISCEDAIRLLMHSDTSIEYRGGYLYKIKALYSNTHEVFNESEDLTSVQLPYPATKESVNKRISELKADISRQLGGGE